MFLPDARGYEREAGAPSTPLITNDPYFSVWSPGPLLNGQDTCNWTGASKKIRGTALVDGVPFRFLGKQDSIAELPQTGAGITPTSSRYLFEGAGIRLGLNFTSPLLLSDPDLVSRPVSYISFQVLSLDGKEHELSLSVSFDEAHCYDGEARQEVEGFEFSLKNCRAVRMGKRKQSPLNHSGDDITIDWGYLYLAVPRGTGTVSYCSEEGRHSLKASFECKAAAEAQSFFLAAAYDDIVSINYFGDLRKAYWARNGKTMLTGIVEAIDEYGALTAKCEVFDASLEAAAEETGGKGFKKICALAYRQSIAAHKLIADSSGDPVFISKECFSNGCAATVDVSYPSVPLFLLYKPELVIAMLRPIFRFARTPVWKFDFAPHDAGRYPYLTGQVYAYKHAEGKRRFENGSTIPDIFSYPETVDIYNFSRQMPVEECGNMLIMSAAAALACGSAAFAEPYADLLEKWSSYLVNYGSDPGEQLCTDDFAGHLAHNINLAAKAIMGIEAWSILLAMMGRPDESEWYHRKAKEMAAGWREKADRGDHTGLVFGDGEGWSLKYNLIWDKLFGSGLFPEQFYENEISYYIKKLNEYGTPLDSRKNYTKSDWIVWAASMASGRNDMIKLIEPVARFLEETPDKVPFSDWYDTVTGKKCGFQNRTVQGGLFMPLLVKQGGLKYVRKEN
jgi:hypothetical protein